MMAKLERSPQQARMEAVSRDALVQAALQEITQNYREASLSNVARAYGVSLAYVSECVRAQTGRTYKELLQKHRMETAARLLRRSDLNIQQIIAQVGYENTSYFYRLFHERYGLSPREYRLVRTGTAPRRPTACFASPDRRAAAPRTAVCFCREMEKILVLYGILCYTKINAPRAAGRGQERMSGYVSRSGKSRYGTDFGYLCPCAGIHGEKR